MTVEQLIQELQKYDKNMQVIGTWEGIGVPVHGIYTQDNAVCLNVDEFSFEWNDEEGE
jgi:hypothetical protein